MPCGCSSVGSGRSTTMLSMVGRSNFISWRLAPSSAKPIGTPWPSLSTLRFTPLLPRSVGWGPGFFPAQRSFHHGPVHTQPLPVEPFSLIKLCQSCLPEFEEDSRLHPFLKAIMRRRMCSELGLVQGLPLTASSQHVEDRVGTVSIRYTRPSSRHPRWVFTWTGSSGCSCAH